jgi:hypothetical protein
MEPGCKSLLRDWMMVGWHPWFGLPVGNVSAGSLTGGNVPTESCSHMEVCNVGDCPA